MAYPELATLFDYLEKGTLPDNDAIARNLMITRRGRDRARSYVTPPLQPIPVMSSFEKNRVVILQLLLTLEGNLCALVFINYLTKILMG